MEKQMTKINGKRRDLIDYISYRVDNVVCRTHWVEYSEGKMVKLFDGDEEEDFGDNFVENFARCPFVEEMGDVDELYQAVKRSLTVRLEPQVSIEDNVIVLKKLAKANGENPTKTEVYEWQDQNMELRVIEYRFRVVRTRRSVDFDLDGVLDEEELDTIMGFKTVNY